jgi:hypothetical protein
MSFTVGLRAFLDVRSLRRVGTTADFHGEAFISRKRKTSNAYAARRECYSEVKSLRAVRAVFDISVGRSLNRDR